ncbi:MAG: HXXEE domain-containing protein [Muribaculaceae bacterium]|nr:HXXEE domain-containing protein [Muribaculaceae bacterium]
MFSILFYIGLPVAVFFHLAEEAVARRKFAHGWFFVLAILELTVACGATMCGMRELLEPLMALTWGFNMHCLWHLGRALTGKHYMPGSITGIVLLPYIGLTFADMLTQWSLLDNAIYAVAGCGAVALSMYIKVLIYRKL